MPYTMQIVCLANSYKHPNGRCFAGKETRGGAWLRPISARSTHEVASNECRYADGTLPGLLDIVNVPLSAAVPRIHQTENHVLQSGEQWTRTGHVAFADLEALRDDPPGLWVNRDSTVLGSNDCISPEEAAAFTHSLLLIRPDDFSVETDTNPWSKRPSYRGDFHYKGAHYNMSLTDPQVRDRCGSEPGHHPFTNVYICVSLTEVYEKDSRCHKLVAAVIADPLL